MNFGRQSVLVEVLMQAARADDHPDEPVLRTQLTAVEQPLRTAALMVFGMLMWFRNAAPMLRAISGSIRSVCSFTWRSLATARTP